MKSKSSARKTKTDRQQYQATADKLWASLVKDRANGMCEVCGKMGNDAHHMIARAKSRFLRHRLENGMFLCHSCHFCFHNKESVSAWEMLKANRYSDWEFLWENKHTPATGKYADALERLRDL